jgi:hypothetical protein
MKDMMAESIRNFTAKYGTPVITFKKPPPTETGLEKDAAVPDEPGTLIIFIFRVVYY